jgi:hypothetical protein
LVDVVSDIFPRDTTKGEESQSLYLSTEASGSLPQVDAKAQLDFDLYLIREKLILGTMSNFNGFAGKADVVFWSPEVASKVSGFRCQK